MEYPKCRICSARHAGMAHVFDKPVVNKGNPAINKRVAITKPTHAITKPKTAITRPIPAIDSNAITAEAVSERTPNRQDRAAYNAYQREYKRKMRAAT